MGLSWHSAVEIKLIDVSRYKKRARQENIFQERLQQLLDFLDSKYKDFPADKLADKDYEAEKNDYSGVPNYIRIPTMYEFRINHEKGKVYWNSGGYGVYDELLEEASKNIEGTFAQFYAGTLNIFGQYAVEFYINGERDYYEYQFLDQDSISAYDAPFTDNFDHSYVVVESIDYLLNNSHIFPDLAKFISKVINQGYTFPTETELRNKRDNKYTNISFISLGIPKENYQTKVITYELVKQELEDYIDDDNYYDEQYSICQDFDKLAILQLKYRLLLMRSKLSFNQMPSPSIFDLSNFKKKESEETVNNQNTQIETPNTKQQITDNKITDIVHNIVHGSERIAETSNTERKIIDTSQKTQKETIIEEKKVKSETPKTMATQFNIENLKVGDYLSEIQYYKIIKINPKSIKIVNQKGVEQNLDKTLIVEQMYSASLYDDEQKVSRTQISAILQKAGSHIFAVNFNKQVKDKDIQQKLLAAIKDEKGNLLNSEEIEQKIKNISKELAKGEERTLIGYLVESNNQMGRSEVIDLEISPDKYRVRQIDHRTINWLIFKNTKYVVK